MDGAAAAALVMAAADFTTVRRLMNKANELNRKEHCARAAEKFGAAATAAKALGNEPDCLMTAYLLACEADFLKSHSRKPGLQREEALAALSQALQKLRTVCETLQRRKAAGTFVVGACRPIEEAWFKAVFPHVDVRLAPFVGYSTYVVAGSVACTLGVYLAHLSVTLQIHFPFVELNSLR